MKLNCINCGVEVDRVKCRTARCFECTKDKKNAVAKEFQARKKTEEYERFRLKRERLKKEKSDAQLKVKEEKFRFLGEHISLDRFVTYANQKMYIRKSSFLKLMNEAQGKWTLE